MPKWRSASARARSGVISMACRRPSSTMKSFPVPCIFVKVHIMPCIIRSGPAFRASVEAGLAPWPRLVAAMHPVILRRVGADPVFDQAVDPGGCFFRLVLAGEVVHGWHHRYLIATRFRIQATHDRYDGSIETLGDLGRGQQCGGGHAEEGNERRAV